LLTGWAVTGARPNNISPPRLLVEMICKRIHRAGSGAGPSLGGEPTTCGCLIAQAFGTIGVVRKNFSGWLGVQRWLRRRKRERTRVSQPRKCLPSDCRAICSC